MNLLEIYTPELFKSTYTDDEGYLTDDYLEMVTKRNELIIDQIKTMKQNYPKQIKRDESIFLAEFEETSRLIKRLVIKKAGKEGFVDMSILKDFGSIIHKINANLAHHRLDDKLLF